MLQANARASRRLFGAKAGTPKMGAPRNERSDPIDSVLAEAGPMIARDHWTVGGFDQMRSQQPAPRQDVADQPQGPLGNSMRQPFDYDKAMKVLTGDYKKPKDWQIALAILGDGLAGASGRQGYAVQNIVNRRDAYAQRQFEAAKQIMEWQQDDYARNQEADLRAAAPFSSGRDRVQFDPATGQSRVIYDGAEDFQTYADELGLAPGSEEYFKAVEDYVLRSAGPSAYERDVSLDDHRTGNDAELERVRNGFRVGLEHLRQGNRRGMVDYRNANPPPARRAARQNAVVPVKTPAEAAKLSPGTRYRGPDGVVRER